MQGINIFLIIILSLICINIFGQGTNCITADPFCTGTTYDFPAPVNNAIAESGPDYGCLSSQLNPVWYYLQVDLSGNFVLDIHSSNGADIDYICWGPFTSSTTPCSSGLTSSKIVSCSYSSSSQEWCNIPNTLVGEYYILLITNNSNTATNINISQTNNGQVGAGSTICYATWSFDNITNNVSSCNPITNYYSVSGNLIFHFAPSYTIVNGTLVLVDQPSGINQVLYGPFSNSSSPIPYNLYNIPSDGLQHTLTATFSQIPICYFSVTYNAPDSCLTSSAFESVFSENFSIFPNPVTNGSFKINNLAKGLGEFSIRIINIQGVEVFRKLIPKNSESIEINIGSSGLIDGSYLFEINDGQKLIRKSLLIQNNN
jgi:hypothetical protein